MSKPFLFLFAMGMVVVQASDSRSAPDGSEVPAALIAAGKALWVDSAPRIAVLNARVDIGSMRQVGDELEGVLRWPATPASPRISIETTRVLCTPSAELYYEIALTEESTDGRVLERVTYDHAVARKKAETDRWRPQSYSPNPRSLLCWAAARKCEGKPFTWPPPPNLKPLEHSERATKMQDDYNKQFVPTCKLPGGK